METVSEDGVVVTSRVIENGSSKTTNKLRLGAVYGHQLDVDVYLALWHTELTVVSELRDMQQLQFMDRGNRTQSWTFQLQLRPNRRAGDRLMLLACLGRKVRRADEIRTTVTKDSGATQAICLSVEIV